MQTINIILIHIAYNNIFFLQYGCGLKSSRGWMGRRDFFSPRPKCAYVTYQFAFQKKKKHQNTIIDHYTLSGKSILRLLARHHRFPPFTRRHDLCLSRLNDYKRSLGDTSPAEIGFPTDRDPSSAGALDGVK